MERFKVDDEGAFQMLVKSSQDTNMKLTRLRPRAPAATGKRVAEDVGATAGL